jgi:hypothetical protein
MFNLGLRLVLALVTSAGMAMADQVQSLPIISGWGRSDDATPVIPAGIDALTVHFTMASGDQRIWSFQKDATRTWEVVDGQQRDLITSPASGSLPELERLAQTLVQQAPETPSSRKPELIKAGGHAIPLSNGSLSIILKTNDTTPPRTIVLPCRRNGQVPDQAAELMQAMKAEAHRLRRRP